MHTLADVNTPKVLKRELADEYTLHRGEHAIPPDGERVQRSDKARGAQRAGGKANWRPNLQPTHTTTHKEIECPGTKFPVAKYPRIGKTSEREYSHGTDIDARGSTKVNAAQQPPKIAITSATGTTIQCRTSGRCATHTTAESPQQWRTGAIRTRSVGEHASATPVTFSSCAHSPRTNATVSDRSGMHDQPSPECIFIKIKEYWGVVPLGKLITATRWGEEILYESRSRIKCPFYAWLNS